MNARSPLAKAQGASRHAAWLPWLAVRQCDDRNGEARSKSRQATDKESAS